MTVNKDAARRSKKKVNVKGIRQRVKTATAKMNKEMTGDATKKSVHDMAEAFAAPAPVEPPKQAPKAKVKPAKITVKQAVLDLFYAVQGKVYSTPDAVSAIRATHPGMNESSIRVWITDFQKDGSLKNAGRDGRKVLLTTGRVGGRFSKNYVN